MTRDGKAPPGAPMWTRTAWPLLAAVVACQVSARQPEPDNTSGPIADAFAVVPDSDWIAVVGPTLIGFYPIVSNDQLERDEDLATVLDDFAYHIGTAMDSLIANRFMVHYRGGDTIWLRTGSRQWRFVRDADSADVGYLFTEPGQQQLVLYGVRSYLDLIEDAHAFRQTLAAGGAM